MKLLKYVAALGLTAAAGITAAAAGIYYYGFYSPRGQQNDDHHIYVTVKSKERLERSLRNIDELCAKPYEPVYIRSFDNLRLRGRYYHWKDGAPLAILCHGYRGTPPRDFCGGANLFFSLGFNVLMIEERAHCGSEGHTITFGVKERYDVLNWCRYAVKRFGRQIKIILAGISMGGGTVLMASALDLPENVRGILADCPFTSPAEIVAEVGKARGIRFKFAYTLTALAARLFGGFSLKGADAAEAVKQAKVPILILHGEADDLVPCDMSRKIAANNPALIELHTFPGALHGQSYTEDKARYAALVEAFVQKALNTDD